MSDSAADFQGASRRGRRGLIYSVLVLGCYSLGAAVMAALIASHLAFPPVPDIAERYQYFAERKADFDTVFIGSSHFRNQIIPQQFDTETAALGVQTHSFNLGYSGMWPPESFYFLHQVLALRPPHLRWVVIELMDYRFSKADDEPATMRTMYWHDGRNTARFMGLLLESPLPLAEKSREFFRHAWLFLQRTVNPGRGVDWLKDRYFPERKKPDINWMQTRGFDPEPGSMWGESARAEYRQQIEAFGKAGPATARRGLAAALRQVIADVQAAGAQPIFLLAPSVRPEENVTEGLPAGMTILAFNDPAKYPRLYQPELHYDPGHLNPVGARLFTSLLAQRFAEVVGQH